MSIETLSFQGVRNLVSTNIGLSPKINVFFGDNGAGKTSILEAAHFLIMARSFRLSRTRTVISHELEELLVSGHLTDHGLLAIRRNVKGQYQVRLRGETIKALAELVGKFPMQLIHSDSFALLEGSPSDRRQFLDWGVFHQTPDFHVDWQTLQKSLKNRNSLLRSGRIDRSEMAVWEHSFLTSAERLDTQRQAYLKGFVPCFHKVLSDLIDLSELRIHYYRGWDKDKGLKDVLEYQSVRDIKLGYTQSGPQRADMRIKVGKTNAADVLSRGQQKLVVCALKIAQSLYLEQQHKQPTIFLIDDLPAELDHRHIKKLGSLMESLNAQVLMTCVDPTSLVTIWKEPSLVKVFHVEHGEVSATKNLGENA